MVLTQLGHIRKVSMGSDTHLTRLEGQCRSQLQGEGGTWGTVRRKGRKYVIEGAALREAFHQKDQERPRQGSKQGGT